MRSRPSSFNVLDQLGALRRYAASLTRDQHDAEDLVQEALARAYAQRHQLRSAAHLRGWLLSILHNVFVSDWRKRRKSGGDLVSLDDAVEAGVEPGQEHVVRLNQIKRAFMQLPDDQRAALHLVTIEGMSYQEAAAALDVPVGTLMSRLSRARAALRDLEDMPDAAQARRRSLKVVGGRDVER